MDVKEFVAETLRQATEAVQENQSTFSNGRADVAELKKLICFLTEVHS